MKQVSFILLLTLVLLAAPYAPVHADEAAPACREQLPYEFLIRANMKKAREGFKKAVERAIRFRVEHYGFVPDLSPHYGTTVSAPDSTELTLFLGLPVRLHKKILPAVRCAEEAVRTHCLTGPQPYQPERLSGLRTKNSYRGGEISNHMFGLALDVDPDRNPCCGCVPPWSDVPKCKNPRSVFDRMDMPRCWVEQFERFGFYWLGWDEMQDTMHFEFLGDPDRIR